MIIKLDDSVIVLSELLNRIVIKSGIFAVVSVFVVLAMAVDFCAGIRKAKRLGEYIHSQGLKRTARKFSTYFSSLFLGFLVDIILSPFTYLLTTPLDFTPFITIVLGILLIYTEFKSVREKGSQKMWRQMDSNLKELAELYSKVKELEELKLFEKDNKNTLKKDEEITPY